jgi:hypothetical protein
MMCSTGFGKRPLPLPPLDWREVRDPAGALPGAPDQDVNLPPGQAQ